MAKMSLNKSKIEEINSKLYLESRSNPTDTIKMDVPLFLRMLEYAKEDAKTDMDLHDATEKAISLSSSGKTLTMAEYDSIVGGELNEKKLTAAEKRKKEDIVKGMKKSFKGDKGVMYAIATSKAKKLAEDEISEAYVPDNIKSFAKRKGVSSLVNKAAGWAEKIGKRITGGTAIGKNYSTIILDMGYQTADIYINIDNDTIELYGEEVNSFPEFKKVYQQEKGVEEGLSLKQKSKVTEANERGLMVFGRTPLDNNAIADMIDDGDFYAEWNVREGYWLFPEDESTYDELELELEKEFNERGINARFEGIFEANKPKIPISKQKSRMVETILSKLKGE